MSAPRFMRTRARATGARVTTVLRATLMVGLVLASGCAGGKFAIPTSAATPRADGSALWADASKTCRDIDAFGGSLRGSGRLAGSRVPGLRLDLALERSGRAAVEARVSGTLFFSLRGTSADSTLVLFQERRIVTGRVDQLLNALVGLSIGPERLLAVLAGCVSNGGATLAETVGNLVRVRTNDAAVFLMERAGRWRVRAGTFDGLVAAYEYRDGAWPARVRITSEAGRVPAVELSLALDAADTNPRDPSVFTVRVPEGFERVTPEWVRENGPLGEARR